MAGARGAEKESAAEINQRAQARVDRIAFAVGHLSEVHTRQANPERTKANITERQRLALNITYEQSAEIERMVQKEEIRLAELLYSGTLLSRRQTDTPTS